jgi:phosphoribosyl-ATP pyrophosphohydrolase/phosphoribosyl-AMP cyclohydrolase
MKLQNLKFDDDGLIPVVIQDSVSLEVLMVGWMNETTIRMTLEQKRVVFWSRSRNEIWLKGATSGNFLNLVTIMVDCDRDTLLIQVHPQGPTCHTGSNTCFYSNYLIVGEI